MAEKTISIIVPIYKTEKYLKRCVDSLLCQTYERIEIVLVDDGSPDGCPEMCDAYAKKDGRVKAVHKENGGLVSAWKAGVEASEGEYLCFVDSDDWVEAEMLEDMVSCLSEGKEDAREVICCNFLINRPGRETRHYHGLAPGVYEGRRLQEEVKDHLLGHENRMISMLRCMKLFSRSLIEENMKYSSPDITMGEDVSITLPVLLDSKRVVILKDALYYHYFYNDESMVHKYDAGMYEGIKKLYRMIQEIYRVKNRKNGQEQADKEYLYLLLLAVKNEIRGGVKGYMGRVKSICREEKNRKVISAYKISVEDRTNKLMYFVLCHPSKPVMGAIWIAFRIYGGFR